MKQDNRNVSAPLAKSNLFLEAESNPFITHRKVVFQHYGAACKLRGMILSLWNGRAHPFPLHVIGGLDSMHFDVAISFLKHYHRYGENDRPFMDLAAEIKRLEDSL